MKNKIKKIYQLIVTIFTAIFFIFAIYVFIATAVARKNNTMASIFGYTYSIVPTESMVPVINPGDSVIGQKVKYEKLNIGDDVIYYSEKENIFIVHRIIDYTEGVGFTVKGVNNPIADTEKVTKDNYVAKVIWSGTFANIGELVLNNRGTIFLLLVGVLMLIAGNGIFDIIKIAQEKKKVEEKKEIVNEYPTEEELRQQVYEELRRENLIKEDKNKDDENKDGK